MKLALPCLDTFESLLIEDYNARAVYTEFSNDCLQLSDNDTNEVACLASYLIPRPFLTGFSATVETQKNGCEECCGGMRLALVYRPRGLVK